MHDMRPVPAALLVSFLDDAALFPPGNAPMVAAVPAHARHRQAWYGPLVGYFVCPDVRLRELAAVLSQASFDLPVGVVVSRGPEAISAAVGEATELGLGLVAIEVPLGTGDGAAERARRAVRAIAGQPFDIQGYVEVPLGHERRAVLDALSTTPVAAKLRTGGLSAEGFPTEAEVASFLVDCATRDVPFKCTAGLHRAVRHRAEPEGFERHGIANVLVATAASLAGASEEELIVLLGEQDENTVAASLEQAVAARGRFRSLGTCSVEEPIDDLVRLGLVRPPAMAKS
jgi:hypothetical protein